MTQYRNSFESGTAGASVTAASSSGNDTPITGRGTNTGATILYSNFRTINGLLSAEFAYADSTAAYIEYTIAPATATTRVAVRAYIYHGAYPSASNDIYISFRNSAGAVAVVGQASPSSPVTVAGSNSGYVPPRQTWMRYEVACTPGTTTSNGKSELNIYIGESQTPVATASNSATNTGTSIFTAIRFGCDSQFGQRTNYIDNVAIDDALASGFIGPAFTDMGGSPSAWIGV